MTDGIIYAIGLVNGALLCAWLVERSHRHDHDRLIRKHGEELQAVHRRATDQDSRTNSTDRALDQLYNKTGQRREKS